MRLIEVVSVISPRGSYVTEDVLHGGAAASSSTHYVPHIHLGNVTCWRIVSVHHLAIQLQVSRHGMIYYNANQAQAHLLAQRLYRSKTPVHVIYRNMSLAVGSHLSTALGYQCSDLNVFLYCFLNPERWVASRAVSNFQIALSTVQRITQPPRRLPKYAPQGITIEMSRCLYGTTSNRNIQGHLDSQTLHLVLHGSNDTLQV